MNKGKANKGVSCLVLVHQRSRVVLERNRPARKPSTHGDTRCSENENHEDPLHAAWTDASDCATGVVDATHVVGAVADREGNEGRVVETVGIRKVERHTLVGYAELS